MQFIYLLLMFMMLSACSNELKKHEQSSEQRLSTASTDSSSVSPKEQNPNTSAIDQILSKVSSPSKMPFSCDSIFLSSLAQNETLKDLNRSEVSLLSQNFEGNAVYGGYDSYINDFKFIDSLIEHDLYEDYVAGLDIGMTQNSIAKIVTAIEIDAAHKAVLWCIDYHTYEACPYGYGTFVFASIIANDTISNSTLVGELSGGGDPPAWGEHLLTSTLDAAQWKLTDIQRSGEEDDSGKETIDQETSSYTLQISNSTITKKETL